MKPAAYPAPAAPVAAPHVGSAASVANVMIWVMAALTPATLYGFWLFGWPAIHLWWITVAFAAAGEGICLRLSGRPALATLRDGSAILTGWLLALSLPPWAPWWIGACGGLIATVIAKQVFGGLGQNLFNPAMVARVALLISFPVPMTLWVIPVPLDSAGAPGFVEGLQLTLGALPGSLDAVASASVLGHAKTELARGVDLLRAFAVPSAPTFGLDGMRAGSLGETSSLLIAGGGLVLLARGIIGWHVPLAMLAGIALPAAALHALDPTRHLDAASHLLAGGTMLGAFFIATDYVTSPNTRAGQLLFGAGVGLLTFVIRSWGGYPEGVAFAVLLMNALVPVIDRYLRPRVHGRDRRGRPLDLPERV